MAVKKIKWIRMYKALKSDPHSVNTSPFVFVIVAIMLGDERKDDFLHNNLFLSKPPGLRAFSWKQSTFYTKRLGLYPKDFIPLITT